MVHRAMPASCSGESRRGRSEEGDFQRETNANDGRKGKKRQLSLCKKFESSAEDTEVKRKNTLPLPMVHRSSPVPCGGESRRGKLMGWGDSSGRIMPSTVEKLRRRRPNDDGTAPRRDDTDANRNDGAMSIEKLHYSPAY